MPNYYTSDRVSAGGAGIYSEGASGGAASYAGTVAALTFAATLSVAAGTYTAPGVIAYAGSVASLTFASTLGNASGVYTPSNDEALDAPLFGRSIIAVPVRRIGTAAL